MPAVNSAGASRKKKEDVSEKLKEIKQRQANWLKQREQSKHSTDEFHLASNTKAKLNNSRGSLPNKVMKQTRSNSEKIETPSKEVKEQFKHWRNERHHNQHSKDEGDDIMSVTSDAESELERLMTPDVDTIRQPVPEEDFDDLANRIAKRVKGDMGMDDDDLHISPISSVALNAEGNDIEYNQSRSSTRCKTFTQEIPSLNHLGTSGLTSHSCVVCKKLMLASSHIPMMIIPCGHTVCKMCSEGTRICPSCNCPLVSLTVNIMLQQVIQEYHANPKSTLTDSATIPKENNNKELSKKRYVEDNRRNKMASYTKQLTDLLTRQEILSNENSTLMNQRKHVTDSLHHEQRQVQNIQKQEEDLNKSIFELQQRLKVLKEHREQYENKIEELQDQESEVNGKISLLSGTITSLNREIEKVKLLAEGE